MRILLVHYFDLKLAYHRPGNDIIPTAFLFTISSTVPDTFITMDDGEISINPEDINRLSDREKRELQIFLQGESQKAQVQKRTH